MGSRNVDSARLFVAKLVDPEERTKAYGNYSSVYNDPVRGIISPLNLIEHDIAGAGR